MPHVTTAETLLTTDGLSLAVRHHTAAAPGTASESLNATPAVPAAKPTIVAVHGYPDNSGVWNALIPHLLPQADVVTYDVRGTGASDEPTERSGYRLPQLVADLDAVVTAATERASGPVHLLAHDWGSIQAWQAVTDRGASSRVASFTSISGPCLDHVDRWIRRGLRRDSGYTRDVLSQLSHSSYIAFFKVRGLAEFAGATGLLARVMRSASDTSDAVPGFSRTRRDITNGLELYRQNMLTKRRAPSSSTPRGPRTTEVPVQIITPTADPYVRPPMGACAQAVMPNVTVTPIDGGHWIIASDPADVAAAVLHFVEEHPAAATASSNPSELSGS